MKVVNYGYNPETKIGYVTYKPNFIERFFCVKGGKKEYKRNARETYLWGGDPWIDLKTGEEGRNKYLDCAVNLCDFD